MKVEFPSPWLKADENVQHGDNIRFMDEGEMRQGKNGPEYIVTVGIIPSGEKEIADKKKFSLNKTNFESIRDFIGSDDTKNWVGKEMQVITMKVKNPQGHTVTAVRLVPPGVRGEVEIANTEVDLDA